MKAILIDAKNREVREVEYDGKLSSAYKLLGCDLVDVVGLPNLDSGEGDSCHDMFVDDEGLLKGEDDDDAPFFIMRNGWMFAGSGLILGGPDEDGNSMPARLSADDVRPHVAFASRKQLREADAEPKPRMEFYSF